MLTWRDDRDLDPVLVEELLQSAGLTRARSPELLAAMLAGSRWVVSAWEGDTIVAFGRAVSDGVSNAYVTTVAVRPGWQRRGIGTELMRRLMGDRPGIKWVLHASAAGERLYPKVGFVPATGMWVKGRS